MRRVIRFTVLLALVLPVVSGCGIYSFSGTSIQPDVKSIAVEYFQNNALKVNPTLASNLSEFHTTDPSGFQEVPNGTIGNFGISHWTELRLQAPFPSEYGHI